MESYTITCGIMNICVQYIGVTTIYINPSVQGIVDVTIHNNSVGCDFYSTITVTAIACIIYATVIYHRRT